MTTHSPSRRALLGLIVLSLIWGYNWVMMKEALRFAAPFDFAALRTLPGALSLFAAMIWMKKPLAPVAPLRLLLLGLFQTAGFIALSSWALVAGARARPQCWCSPCPSGPCFWRGRSWGSACADPSGSR